MIYTLIFLSQTFYLTEGSSEFNFNYFGPEQDSSLSHILSEIHNLTPFFHRMFSFLYIGSKVANN